jgi:hypothetical protein
VVAGRGRAGRWHRPGRIIAGAVRRRPAGDTGSSIAEFALVSVLLVFLLLAVVQVAIYLHIRNVAVASAAEGARYAANADADPGGGAARAGDLLARGIGAETAGRLRCTGEVTDGPAGVRLSAVRCAGAIPVFFAPIGGVLPLEVTGHAVEEAP